MGQEVRGGRKVDEGIGERNFLLPAAWDLLRGSPSPVLHPPGFLPVLTLSPFHPHLFAVQSCDPFAHAEADVLYDCGVGCTENNYASAKRDATPSRWKDLRGWDPYNGADKVTTNIFALYNLVRLHAFFMSRIFRGFRVKKKHAAKIYVHLSGNGSLPMYSI